MNWKHIARIVILVALALPAAANFVQVRNVELRRQRPEARAVEVAFDLGWENSWRNDLNHDAAWVFVKFRAPGSNHWQHAYLTAADGAVNNAPGGVVALGSSPVGGQERAVGAFIYSANCQTGTVSYSRTRLTWDYGASGYNWAAGTELEVSVHAIEMVYVAEGAFYVGSGGTESGSFTEGSWQSGATIPFMIAGEDEIGLGPAPDNLWGTSTSGNNSIGVEGTLPAAFPKGHAPFYCMKYAITQGQYAEFLNLLTYAQQASRAAISPAAAAGTYLHGAYRHAIHVSAPGVNPGTPAAYATDNPYVACNYLSYADVAAYTQWSGLRPMTGLEFEKACRGPATPVANEYAWGTAAISGTGGGANYSDLGAYNESVSQGNAIYSGSSPGGPARVGIFATAGAARVAAGASYWGIMELSGNLWERAVSVANGRFFTGVLGDGTLPANGDADAADWPTTNASGAGLRGGNWYHAASSARVSDRGYAAYVDAGRRNNYGGRAVRSAPSGVAP